MSSSSLAAGKLDGLAAAEFAESFFRNFGRDDFAEIADESTNVDAPPLVEVASGYCRKGQVSRWPLSSPSVRRDGTALNWYVPAIADIYHSGDLLSFRPFCIPGTRLCVCNIRLAPDLYSHLGTVAVVKALRIAIAIFHPQRQSDWAVNGRGGFHVFPPEDGLGHPRL
jgi:hypothetical protein